MKPIIYKFPLTISKNINTLIINLLKFFEYLLLQIIIFDDEKYLLKTDLNAYDLSIIEFIYYLLIPCNNIFNGGY